MKLSRERLLELLRLLEVTEVEEIDCSEFLSRVAGFVERMEAKGTPPGYEAVLQHMKVCVECRDECESLIRALQEEEGDGSTPTSRTTG